MSQAFIQKAKAFFQRSVPAPITRRIPSPLPSPPIPTPPPPAPIAETIQPEQPSNATDAVETIQPEQPSNITDAAENAADEEGSDDVEEACQSCLGKWLIVTITRHTKVKFDNWISYKGDDGKIVLDKNGKPKKINKPLWDCTLGDLKMELCDSQDSESGEIIFSCHTVERGARNGIEDQKKTKNGSAAAPMVYAPDVHGINIHVGSGTKIRTYKYVKQNDATNQKPRAGLGVYGDGISNVSGGRLGICIHHGTTHRWSIGCILLTSDPGKKDGARWCFGGKQSYQTVLNFREKVLDFSQLTTARVPKSTPGVKRLEQVKLKIVETFQ